MRFSMLQPGQLAISTGSGVPISRKTSASSHSHEQKSYDSHISGQHNRPSQPNCQCVESDDGLVVVELNAFEVTGFKIKQFVFQSNYLHHECSNKPETLTLSYQLSYASHLRMAWSDSFWFVCLASAKELQMVLGVTATDSPCAGRHTSAAGLTFK